MKTGPFYTDFDLEPHCSTGWLIASILYSFRDILSLAAVNTHEHQIGSRKILPDKLTIYKCLNIDIISRNEGLRACGRFLTIVFSLLLFMQRELSVRYAHVLTSGSSLEMLSRCRVQTEPSRSASSDSVLVITLCRLECSRITQWNLLIWTASPRSQGAPGLGSADAAAAPDAQRAGEHAAGQRPTHHHQVPHRAQWILLWDGSWVRSFNTYVCFVTQE